MTAAEVADLLRGYRFRFTDEDSLQALVLGALEREGIEATREVRLDPRNRVDVLVGAIVVEVKVAGMAADVARQLSRYARFEQVEGIVLVTSRARHVFPHEIEGKPVEVVSTLLGGFLL